MKPNHLELKSADGIKINLEALYQIAPSCFTEVKDEKTGELRHVVNFTTLRQLLGDDAVDDAPEMYQFTWPGKQEARREAARPITDTLRPCPEESVDWDTTQNLYIEGDNLAVLKLLQKGYMGKVKMIYIDPPYNTGNDFVYHDDFAVSQKEMDLFSGDVDEEGNRYRKNTDSNGRFHSDWCSMMYSRLLIARSLLSDNGLICISIDNNEIENLRKICDEIFGPNNCVAQLVWKNKYGAGGGTNGIAYVHEYILVYSKTEISSITCELSDELIQSYNKRDEKYSIRGGYVTQPLASTSKGARANLMYTIHHDGHEIQPPQGGRWIWSKEKFDEAYNNNEVVINKTSDGWSVRFKQYLRDENGNMRKGTQLSMITNVFNQDGTKEFAELMGDKRIFDFPKPTALISQLLKLEINGQPNTDEIVLDFFSGSAATAQAVMQLNSIDGGNRRFICIQLPEATPEDSVARQYGYINIPEIAKERIRRAGKKIIDGAGLLASDQDTGFRVLKLDNANFNNVEYAPKEFTQDLLSGLESNIKEGRTDLDLLFGAMLDWGVQLSLPMSKETVDGCDIYTVNEGDLVACFSENVTENVVSAMAAKMPLRVLFRDSCFSEDKAKINVFELFKQKLDWGEDEAIKNIRVI